MTVVTTVMMSSEIDSIPRYRRVISFDLKNPLVDSPESDYEHGAQRRRSSQGIRLHAPSGRGAEQRLGYFQIFTSDSKYLYTYRLRYTERARVCFAQLTVIAEVVVSKRRLAWEVMGTGNLNSERLKSPIAVLTRTTRAVPSLARNNFPTLPKGQSRGRVFSLFISTRVPTPIELEEVFHF
ncbi:hypothetical protein EVAR_43793_1 [Eumeta japonica]|uniref:Uncharacterized protein n=1 Tax=Eumeta variegata TaxID=151549 RepID=A0A4C1XW47_EUMVA|nr:hypothetical protein EVAR_43793_1 [Eumeta japonica]